MPQKFSVDGMEESNPDWPSVTGRQLYSQAFTVHPLALVQDEIAEAGILICHISAKDNNEIFTGKDLA